MPHAEPKIYESLRGLSIQIAKKIIHEVPACPTDRQRSYIWKEAYALSRYEFAHVEQVNVVAYKILMFLENGLLNYLRGDIAIASLRSKLLQTVGLNYWDQLMNDAPMGDYAKLTSHYLQDQKLLEGTCLELGAGSGNLSRLIHQNCKKLIRTDRNLELINKSIKTETAVYDFDGPGPWKEIDVVVAVNALHCATDKVASLKFIKQMLKPKGLLLMAEGQNTVQSTEPWCLNLLFGLYDGWWDKSGFLDRKQWLDLFDRAGFLGSGWSSLTDGTYDLGGLIWAYAPSA